VRDAVRTGVKAICGFVGCEVVEMNVQRDHVRLVVMIRPKVEVSELLGRLKRQASINSTIWLRKISGEPIPVLRKAILKGTWN